MKRYRPPSRIAYELSHPTVSARLPMAYYRKLTELLNARYISLATLLEETIDNRKAEYSKAVEEARAQERAKWQIKGICAKRCGKDLIVYPNTDLHDDIVRYMLGKGWGHADCKSW